MPLYDYVCGRCNSKKEKFFKADKKKDKIGCGCGGKMKSVITTRTKPLVFDEWDEVLGARVTGPKHRKELMRKHPLHLHEL